MKHHDLLICDVFLLLDEPAELADPELGSKSVGVALIDIPPTLPPHEVGATAADALPAAADSLRHHFLAQCQCERLKDHRTRQLTIPAKRCRNSTSNNPPCCVKLKKRVPLSMLLAALHAPLGAESDAALATALEPPPVAAACSSFLLLVTSHDAPTSNDSRV